MTQPQVPYEGGCRCGRVRFRIGAPPLITMACHCTGCQRMTASAYSLSVAVPSEAFEVIDGEPVIGGIHGDDAHHNHCDYCKSWLFTRPTFDDSFVNVRATMLDDARWYEPFVDCYTSEMLPWATTPAKHRYPQFPAMEDFGALIAEYAAASEPAPRP